MKTLTRTKFRVSRNKAQVFEDVYDKNRQNMSTSYIFPCFVRFNLIYLQVKFLKTSQVKTRCVLLYSFHFRIAVLLNLPYYSVSFFPNASFTAHFLTKLLGYMISTFETKTSEIEHQTLDSI
uniref:Uncharacterized protein n=1 Tax=Cacopsylla melanoneura TaxID=428564 RepID=A0A8D8T4R1_9HEMI